MANITPTIYWAINSGELQLGNSSISGEYSDSFAGSTVFNENNLPPWIGEDFMPLTDISSVNIVNNISLQSGAFLFSNLYYCQDFENLENLDTSNMTDMSYMFYICGPASTGVTLDLSSFDTSNVTNMSHMFEEAGLYELNLSNFDTSRVTDMSHMFHACSLHYHFTLDLSNFDTSNVTNMEGMLAGYGYALPECILDISNFDTSKVTNMAEMFSICPTLKTIYVSDLFDVSSVTLSTNMFEDCESLVGAIPYDSSRTDVSMADYKTGYFTNRTYIPTIYWAINSGELQLGNSSISGEHSGNFVRDTEFTSDSQPWNSYKDTITSVNILSNISIGSGKYFFYNLKNCNEIKNISKLDTSKVTKMNYMFAYCGYSSTTFTLDISSFDTSNVTDMMYMFLRCGYSSTNFTLDVSNFNTSKVTDMAYMFDYCGYSNPNFTLDVSNFNTSKVMDMQGMFSVCGYSNPNFTLDVSNFNTSKVINMSNMFNHCGYSNPNFTLDISNFDTSNVTNMSLMFEYCGYKSTNFKLDLSSFDTSKVTDMSYMFWNCGYNSTVFTLDLSSFDTSNVTNMARMFRYCGYKSTDFTLDLSNFDTSKVTNMAYMFENCGYSNPNFILNVSSFDTSNVTNMSHMFEYCGRESTNFELDLSSFTTSNVTDMSYMFYGCDANLNLSSFNTSNVSDMQNMFRYYGRESTNFELDLSNFNTSNVTDMSYMFNGCEVNLNLSSFDTSNVTNMEGMFSMCGYNIDNFTLNLSSFNTSKVRNMSDMFYYCGSLKTIYASDAFVTTSVTSSSGMFQDCFNLIGMVPYDNMFVDHNRANFDKYLTDIDSIYWAVDDDNHQLLLNDTGFDGGYIDHGRFKKDIKFSQDSIPWQEYINLIQSVDIVSKISINNGKYFFYNLILCNDIGHIDNLDTSKVTDMQGMFEGYGAAVSNFILDLSKFNTSNVTNMSEMFYGCGMASLGNVNLIFSDVFNTSKVTDMSFMFNSCGKLSTNFTLDLSNFDTSNVTNMKFMFCECGYSSKNFTLDLSKFDTSQVKTMESMFWYCGYSSPIFTLNLNGWDTQNVTNMSTMFSKCGYSSQNFELDLSSFNTLYVNDVTAMFEGCKQLKTIYTSEQFITPQISSSLHMFHDCISLVGLIPYDSTQTDGSMANFDKYLTDIDSIYWAVIDDGQLLLNNTGTSGPYIDHGRFKKDIEFSQDSIPWQEYINIIQSVDIVSKISINHGKYFFCKLISCKNINHIDNFDTSKVTDMQGMFESYGSVVSALTLDLSNFDTSSVTNMSEMFRGCGKLSFGTVNLIFSNAFNTSNVTDMSYMFYECGRNAPKLILDLSSFTTLNVTDMSYMFSYCGGSALNFILDISNFDTSKVTDMSYMFNRCGSRATNFTLTFSNNFTTSNVTDMSYMFSYCGYKSTNFILDVSKFNTSQVKNMEGMFNSCGYDSSIFTLDVSSFDTSNVTNMSEMFAYCGYSNPNFTLELSRFDTSKVTDMMHMFYYCGISNLNFILDLSNFNTSKVTDMEGMFEQSRTLKTIYASDLFDVSSVISSSGMFWDCISLVRYDSSKTDKSMANYTTGYFTKRLPTRVYWKYENSQLILSNYIENGNNFMTDTSFTENTQPWVNNKNDITNIQVQSELTIKNPQYWFAGFSNCTDIKNFNNLDFSQATTIDGLFKNCQNLYSVNDFIIPSNTASMIETFYNCVKLGLKQSQGTEPIALRLEDWTIPSSINYFTKAFIGCPNLNGLITFEDIDKLQDKSCPFSDSETLLKLYLKGNIPNNWFNTCRQLKQYTSPLVVSFGNNKNAGVYRGTYNENTKIFEKADDGICGIVVAEVRFQDNAFLWIPSKDKNKQMYNYNLIDNNNNKDYYIQWFTTNDTGIISDKNQFQLISELNNNTDEIFNQDEPPITWKNYFLNEHNLPKDSAFIYGIIYKINEDNNIKYDIISTETTLNITINLEDLGSQVNIIQDYISQAFFTIDFQAGGKEIAFGGSAKTQLQEGQSQFTCKMDSVFENKVALTKRDKDGIEIASGGLMIEVQDTGNIRFSIKR